MGASSHVAEVMANKPSKGLLDNNSRYWASLRDPFRVVGAKIPDVGAQPSITFSSTYRWTQTVDANGVVGARVIPSSFGAISYIASYTSTSATTWNFTNVTADPSGVLANDNMFVGARIVSCGLAVEYAGTSLDNKGLFTGAFQPSTDSTGLTSVTAMANYNGAIQIPVNKSRGIMAVYKPTDYDSFNYIKPSTSAAGAAERDGTLNVVGTGMTPNAQVVFVIKTNYEAIPTTSTFSLIQPSSSKHDPIELSLVMNSIEEEPAVMPDYSPAAGDLASAPTIDLEALTLAASLTGKGKAKETSSTAYLGHHIQFHSKFQFLETFKKKNKDKKVAKKVEKLEKDDRTFFEKLFDWISDNGSDLLKIGGGIASLL